MADDDKRRRIKIMMERVKASRDASREEQRKEREEREKAAAAQREHLEKGRQVRAQEMAAKTAKAAQAAKMAATTKAKKIMKAARKRSEERHAAFLAEERRKANDPEYVASLMKQSAEMFPMRQAQPQFSASSHATGGMMRPPNIVPDDSSSEDENESDNVYANDNDDSSDSEPRGESEFDQSNDDAVLESDDVRELINNEEQQKRVKQGSGRKGKKAPAKNSQSSQSASQKSRFQERREQQLHNRLMVRHGKLVNPMITALTKPAIRRLARRGGVKRIDGRIYDHLRSKDGPFRTWLEKLLQDIVTIVEHSHPIRKTVTVSDVVYALKRQGRTLYGF